MTTKAADIRHILLIAIMVVGSFSLKAQEGAVVMPVKDVFSISGMGVMVMGKVQSGTLKPGMVLEAKGRDKNDTVTIVKIYVNQKEVIAATNEEVSINVRGIVKTDLEMGMVLATPGTLQAGKLVTANIWVLSKEKGVINPVKHNTSVQVTLYDNVNYANLLLKDVTELQPGNKAIAQLKFTTGIAARPGATFSLNVNGKMIGWGIINGIE
jgi:elongation factor Tu